MNAELARASSQVLKRLIQDAVPELIVKNLLFTSRDGNTYLWVTLSAESTTLTPRTFTEIVKVVDVIQSHSDIYWWKTTDDYQTVELSKLDVALDLKGAFLPSDWRQSREMVRGLLASTLEGALND